MSNYHARPISGAQRGYPKWGVDSYMDSGEWLHTTYFHTRKDANKCISRRETQRLYRRKQLAKIEREEAL